MPPRGFPLLQSSLSVATGQEMVGKNKILQDQGKVREFYFESGEIDVLKNSRQKLKGVTNTGNGEWGTGNGSLGTSVQR